jgi:hypothetical protein
VRPALQLRARVARGVARLAWPLVRRLSLRREHRGFRLLSFFSSVEGMDEVAHARIALALDLIAAVDPRRFARIRRDMPNIRVIRAGGGFFEAAIPTCVVDWPHVMWNPVVELAKTIVHEATHARLHRAGIDYPERWQRRIERRCLLEEVAFLRRLPDGGAQAARREAQVEPALASEWWLPHNAIERAIAQARAESVPRWLLRWLEYRQARLARRAAARRGRHDRGAGS